MNTINSVVKKVISQPIYRTGTADLVFDTKEKAEMVKEGYEFNH